MYFIIFTNQERKLKISMIRSTEEFPIPQKFGKIYLCTSKLRILNLKHNTPFLLINGFLTISEGIEVN